MKNTLTLKEWSINHFAPYTQDELTESSYRAILRDAFFETFPPEDESVENPNMLLGITSFLGLPNKSDGSPLTLSRVLDNISGLPKEFYEPEFD